LNGTRNLRAANIAAAASTACKKETANHRVPSLIGAKAFSEIL
jgi:hypothetical protein